MKKCITCLLCLLSLTTVFGQTEENRRGFNLGIILKYKAEQPVQITFTKEDEDPDRFFTGTGCDTRLDRKIDINDTFTFGQLEDYLQDIGIETYNPVSADLDENAHLQVRILYTNLTDGTRAGTVFRYNPDNDDSELKLLFQFILETMEANIIRNCDRDFYDKVKGYLTIEE